MVLLWDGNLLGELRFMAKDLLLDEEACLHLGFLLVSNRLDLAK